MNEVVQWLESEDGEAWSRETHTRGQLVGPQTNLVTLKKENTYRFVGTIETYEAVIWYSSVRGAVKVLRPDAGYVDGPFPKGVEYA